MTRRDAGYLPQQDDVGCMKLDVKLIDPDW